MKKRYFILAQLVFISLLLTGLLILSCDEKKTTGDKSAEVNKSEVGISQGNIAPDFTLKDLNGLEVSLQEFRRKVVLLNFWATWCSPCRREIPSMVELYQRYKDSGLEIIGVNLDKLGKSEVEKFSQEYKINFPVVLNSAGDVASRYGVVVLPTTIFLDRNGRIKGNRISGAVDWTAETNLSQIESLLKSGAIAGDSLSKNKGY